MADKVVVRLSDVQNAIFDGISNNRELRRAADRFIDDAQATWVRVWEESGPHPHETGDYVAHIKKEKMSRWDRFFIKRALREGVPIGKVYNDSDIANLVEYGSGPDRPGSKSPWGPNTPTPEFAPMRRTAARMNEGFR